MHHLSFIFVGLEFGTTNTKEKVQLVGGEEELPHW
jgi:hypothetical protein